MLGSIENIINTDGRFTFNDEEAGSQFVLLEFMKSYPKLKATIPGWVDKIQRNCWTKIKDWSRVLIFYFDGEFRPIKLKGIVMDIIEGNVKGVIKIWKLWLRCHI